jgi:exosome complex component RRP4
MISKKESETSAMNRELVLPGEALNVKNVRPGNGTFVEDGQIYASLLGIKRERGGYVDVIPLSGKYIPVVDDLVIGNIIDIGPSFWLVDVNSPYPATLHVNEVPWRVEFGDTAKYLTANDVILASILSVDEVMRVQVSMKDRSLRRLTEGQIVEFSPSKVPRVIGKKGSMISLIKNYTGCRMFVGQNGRIWIDGKIDGMMDAREAIRMIEEESHVQGLTDAVESFLKDSKGRKKW